VKCVFLREGAVGWVDGALGVEPVAEGREFPGWEDVGGVVGCERRFGDFESDAREFPD